MFANFIEESHEEIIPTGNHCRTQKNSLGRGAEYEQRDLILQNNSDSKTQVMQQQNTILELRKQLNMWTVLRLNFQTSISESLKSQKMTKIDQEPAAERCGEPEIEAAKVDTVRTNERSLITDCGQTDHLLDIKDEAESQSESEEVEQLEHAALSPQEDNFNQSHGPLRMKQVRSACISESDGKRIKLNLGSIEESPTNVRNPQQRSKLYSCGECKKQFNRKGDFTKHIRIHPDVKPYACTKCDFATKYESSLKKHQRSHSGEMPYVCTKCDFAFKYASDLKKHKTTHLDEKPFVCKVCDFAFKYASGLKKHKTTHLDEKPFVCEVCDYACKEPSNLKIHQGKHSDERPFICHICKKTFRYKINLSSHMDTHSDKKAYKCNECQKEYRQIQSLSKHLRKKHSKI